MTPLTNFIALVARILLAYLFVQAGIGKIGGIDRTVANIASHGLPLPNILAWCAAALEIVGGLCLMAGLLARWAALALGAYTLALALILHAYWLAPAAEAGSAIFLNHISIIGGMLAIVAFGAGCLSLDAALRRSA